MCGGGSTGAGKSCVGIAMAYLTGHRNGTSTSVCVETPSVCTYSQDRPDCGSQNKSQIHNKLGCEHYSEIRKLIDKNASPEERVLFYKYDIMEGGMRIDDAEFTFVKYLKNNLCWEIKVRFGDDPEPHNEICTSLDSGNYTMFDILTRLRNLLNRFNLEDPTNTLRAKIDQVNNAICGVRVEPYFTFAPSPSANIATLTKTDMAVFTNIRTDADGTDFVVNYQATIHELWHNIDYLASNDTLRPLSYHYASSRKKNKDGNNLRLIDAIRQDIGNHVREENIREDIKKLVTKLKELSSITPRGSRSWPNAEFYYLFDIINGATEIFYGIINNPENETYKLPFPRRVSGYWGEEELSRIRLSTECFAGFGCVDACVNPAVEIHVVATQISGTQKTKTFKKFDLIKEYLPTAYGLYKEMIKVTLGTGR